MWRFYWRSIRRIPSLALEAVKRVDTAVGLLTIIVWIVIGGTIAGAWWQELPWRVPAIAFVAFLIYGFLRADYEEYAIVEEERNRLQSEKETKEKRAAIGAALQQLYSEGATLRTEMVKMDHTDESRIDVLKERFAEWCERTGNYLAQNVSVGKAQYVVGVPSVNSVLMPGVHPHLTTTVLHLDARLDRLAEVMSEY